MAKKIVIAERAYDLEEGRKARIDIESWLSERCISLTVFPTNADSKYLWQTSRSLTAIKIIHTEEAQKRYLLRVAMQTMPSDYDPPSEITTYLSRMRFLINGITSPRSH